MSNIKRWMFIRNMIRPLAKHSFFMLKLSAYLIIRAQRYSHKDGLSFIHRLNEERKGL